MADFCTLPCTRVRINVGTLAKSAQSWDSGSCCSGLVRSYVPKKSFTIHVQSYFETTQDWHFEQIKNLNRSLVKEFFYCFKISVLCVFKLWLRLDSADLLLDFMDFRLKQSDAKSRTISTLGTFCQCLNFLFYPRTHYLLITNFVWGKCQNIQ